MANALDIYNKYKDKYDKPKNTNTATTTVVSKSNTVLPAKRPVAPSQRIVTTPAPNTPPAPVVSDTGNPFTALPLQFLSGFIPKAEPSAIDRPMVGNQQPITQPITKPIAVNLPPENRSVIESARKISSKIATNQAENKINPTLIKPLPTSEENLNNIKVRFNAKDPSLTYNELKDLQNWARKSGKTQLMNQASIIMKSIRENGVGFGDSPGEMLARKQSVDLYNRDGSKMTNSQADNMYRMAAFINGAVPFGLGKNIVKSVGVNPDVADNMYGSSAGTVGSLGTMTAGFGVANVAEQALVKSVPWLTKLVGNAGLAKKVTEGVLESAKVYSVMGSESLGRNLNSGMDFSEAFKKMNEEILPDTVLFGLMKGLPIKTTKQTEKLINPVKASLAMGALTAFKGGSSQEIADSILLGFMFSGSELLGHNKPVDITDVITKKTLALPAPENKLGLPQPDLTTSQNQQILEGEILKSEPINPITESRQELPAPPENKSLNAPEELLALPEYKNVNFIRKPVTVVENKQSGQTGDIVGETKTGYVVRWHKPSLGETSINKKLVNILPNEIPVNTPEVAPGITTTLDNGVFAIGDRVFNEQKGLGTILPNNRVVWDNGFDARGELVGDTPLVKAGEVIPQTEINNIVKQSEVTQSAITTHETKTSNIIPLHEMSRDELYTLKDNVINHNKNLENDILGNSADEWRLLHRKANSTAYSGEGQKQIDNAVKRIEEIESGLTQEQIDKLYGVNSDIPNIEDVNDYIHNSDMIDLANTPDELSRVISDALITLGDKRNINDMNYAEKLAYHRLKEAYQKANQNGWNTKDISENAVKIAGSKFSDINDAEYVLNSFINKAPEVTQSETPAIVPESPVSNEMPTSEEIPVNADNNVPQSINKEIWQITPSERGELVDYILGVNTPEQLRYQELNSQLQKLKFKHDMLQGKYEKAKSMFQEKPGDTTKKALDKATKDYLPIAEEYKNLKIETDNAYDLYHNVLPAERRAKYPILNSMGSNTFKDAIKQALAEGKPVPPEVLADYPDLSKPVETTPETAKTEVEKDVNNVADMTKDEYIRYRQSLSYKKNSKNMFDADGRPDITLENGDYRKDGFWFMKGSPNFMGGNDIRITSPETIYDRDYQALKALNNSENKLAEVAPESVTTPRLKDGTRVSFIDADGNKKSGEIDGYNGKEYAIADMSQNIHWIPKEDVTPRTKPIESKPVEVKQEIPEVKVETAQGEQSFGGITETDASDALNRVKQKFNNMGIIYKDPIDAETLKDLYTYGKYQISKGFNTFESWSKKMIQEAGETVKPHLESLWARINDNINQGDAVTAKEETEQRDYNESLDNIKSWRNKQNTSVSSAANTGIRKALSVVRQVANRITEEISNHLQPIDTDVIKPIGKKLVFSDKATNNPIIMLNNQRKTTGIVSHIVKEGGALVSKAGKRIDVSLTDLFKEINNMVGKNRESFNLYLEHRLNVERHDQDVILTVPKDALSTISRKPEIDVRGDERTTARYKGQNAVIINQNVDGTYNIKLDKNYKPLKKQWTREASVNAVTAYEKSNPEFVRAAERLYGWQDKFMKEWAVGDIMSKELYEKMRAMYQSYVPARRVEDVELTPEGIQQPVNNNNTSSAGGFDKNTLGAKNPLKRATGGVSELQDFEKQIGENISRYVNATKKNEAFKTLLYWAKKQPDKLKYTMEVVPEKLKLPNKTMDELLDYIEDKNKGIGLSGVPGKYVVRIFQNGEITTLRINDNLYRALNDNTYLEGLGKWTDKVTEPVKYTITGGNIIFTTRNVPMDFQTYMINTIETNPVKAIETYNTALKEMVTNSERWQQYQSLGNIHSTLNYQANKGWAGKGIERNKVFRDLGNFQQGAESIARFAEWINTVEKNGGNYDNYDALQLANYNAANITTDFSRHGRTMQALDKAGFLYANAAVQGVARNFKQVVDKPVESALKLLAYQIVPTMVLAAFNGSNKNYNDLSDRDKDAYFLLPNLLGEKDKDGNATTFTKIPKVRGYRIIGNLLERALRLTREVPEKAFNGYLTNALAEIGVSNTSLNPLNNNIFSTWFKIGNLQNNKTEVDWKNTPYLPKTLQDVIPEEQYNMQTAELAKETAKAAKELLQWGVSPIQLEALVKASVGGLYQASTPIFDYAIKSIKAKQLLPISKDNFDITRPWTADPTYNSELSNKFFSDINTVLATTRDAENKMEYDTKYKLTKEVKSMFDRREDAADYLSEVLSMIKEVREIEKEIEYSKRQIPSEAQSKNLKAMKKEINNMQREYLDNYYYKRKK